MLRAGAALFVMALAACASVPPPSPQSWEGCRCDWLEQRARQLAGPGMTECGFVDLLEEQSRGKLRAGVRCARQAFEAASAFRYGSRRIPMDSYSTEVLVRTADGVIWLMVHDVMLDGDAPQFWAQRCERLRFKPGNSGFVVEGCKAEGEPAP